MFLMWHWHGSLIFQLNNLVFFLSNLKQINYVTMKIQKIWGYVNIVEIYTYEKIEH